MSGFVTHTQYLLDIFIAGLGFVDNKENKEYHPYPLRSLKFTI